MADQTESKGHKPSSASTAQQRSSSSGPTTTQQIHASSASKSTASSRRRTSHSSDETSRSPQKASSSSRSRPHQGPSAKAPSPHDGSSRDVGTMQRSASPSETATKYTKTGRISKAKKGLKVHYCEACGKSYTRAEHLRRHQQNHSGAALRCDWPGCGKTFHRTDLLDRHRERHNDPNNDETRRSSVTSQASSRAYDASIPGPDGGSSPQQPQDVVRGSLPEVTQPTYPVPTSASDMMETVSCSASSAAKIPYSTTMSSFTRAVAPITEDLAAHAGSQFFGDWRWTSPPPEYPPPNSDYASPGHITNYPDYSYVTHPYPTYRPRTLSNASFIDQYMQTIPRSPASATSTQPFYWLDVERDPNLHGLALSDSSGVASYATSDASIYAASSEQLHVPIIASHSTPSFRSFDDLDSEEYRLLFPDHPFGIPVIDPIQMTEWLSNYWLRFHPHFPIKHKPTFEHQREPPLCLAAMLAVGAQYSSSGGAKAQSRALHEKCLKALAKREHDGVVSSRIWDMQAIFLVELISQFCGKRASPSLSSAFLNMYRSLYAEHELRPADALDALGALPRNVDTSAVWRNWVSASSKMRLLAACFILESQQQMLLLRTDIESIVPHQANLPMPASMSAWDAKSYWNWEEQSQQPSSRNAFASVDVNTKGQQTMDAFQSMHMLFVQKSQIGGDVLADAAAAAEDQKGTSLALRGIRLAATTPLYALLAVAGETWVFSEKVKPEPYSAAKQTLHDWTSGFSQHDIPEPSARTALFHALDALRLTCCDTDKTDTAVTLPPGMHLVLYYAALVLWAFVMASSSPSPPSTITPTTSHSSFASSTTPSAASTPPISVFPAAQSFLRFTAAAVVDVDALVQEFRAQGPPLKEWQDGVGAVLAWVAELLGGADTGEVSGGAVRVLEGLKRKGWGGVWF